MSVQALGWVLENSKAKGTDRLVLISLANHAGASPVDGAWEAYPGVQTIAREAGIDRVRTAQEALTRLVAAGHIERTMNAAPDNRIPGNRRPNLYRILITELGVSAERTPGSATDPAPGVSADCTSNADQGCAPRDPLAASGVRSQGSPGSVRGDGPASPGVQPADTQTVIEPNEAAAAALAEAVELVMVRRNRYQIAPIKTSPAGWLHSARTKIHGELAPFAEANPDWDAERLADAVAAVAPSPSARLAAVPEHETEPIEGTLPMSASAARARALRSAKRPEPEDGVA